MRHLRPVVSSALVALGLAAVVPTTVAAAAPARESRAAAAVECIGEYVFDLAPGLSTTPSSGTSFSARPGRLRCSDGRTGTIAFAGRYGTAGPADCTSGGEGWGCGSSG